MIDDALEDARDAATGFLNAEGRHPAHVLLGVALTLGFALAATHFARKTIEPRPVSLGPDDAAITERPRGPLGLVLPADFSATTLSAVRVWNAPARRERTIVDDRHGRKAHHFLPDIILRTAAEIGDQRHAGLGGQTAPEHRPRIGQRACRNAEGRRDDHAVERVDHAVHLGGAAAPPGRDVGQA